MKTIEDDAGTIWKRAELLAQAAHLNQWDKGGKPRIDHARHVAKQFKELMFQCVGLLHDILEDSEITSYDCLAATFGLGVANAVDAITRRKGEQYFAYIKRCAKDPIARRVKIEDIKHNMDRSRWPEMPDTYMEREEKALLLLRIEDQ